MPLARAPGDGALDQIFRRASQLQESESRSTKPKPSHPAIETGAVLATASIFIICPYRDWVAGTNAEIAMCIHVAFRVQLGVNREVSEFDRSGSVFQLERHADDHLIPIFFKFTSKRIP